MDFSRSSAIFGTHTSRSAVSLAVPVPAALVPLAPTPLAWRFGTPGLGAAAAVVSTLTPNRAVAPTSISPVNVITKPVMCPPATAGAEAGRPESSVTVVAAGAVAPPLTDQVITASVAPVGHAPPVTSKPSKSTASEKKVLGAIGSEMVSDCNGPVEVLVAVRVAVTDSPAG